MQVIEVLRETGIIHILAAVLGIVALYFGFRAKKFLGGKFAPKFFNYFFLGIIFLALIHVLEFFTEILGLFSFSHEATEIVEHVLFYIGVTLMVLGFWRILRVAREFDSMKSR